MAKRTEGHRKGRFEYGRRVRSSGGSVPAKHRRRSWGQVPGGAVTRNAPQRRFDSPTAGRVYGPFGLRSSSAPDVLAAAARDPEAS